MFFFFLFLFCFWCSAEPLHAFIILKDPQMMHILLQALFQGASALEEFLSQVKELRGVWVCVGGGGGDAGCQKVRKTPTGGCGVGGGGGGGGGLLGFSKISKHLGSALGIHNHFTSCKSQEGETQLPGFYFGAADNYFLSIKAASLLPQLPACLGPSLSNLPEGRI